MSKCHYHEENKKNLKLNFTTKKMCSNFSNVKKRFVPNSHPALTFMQQNDKIGKKEHPVSFISIAKLPYSNLRQYIKKRLEIEFVQIL